MTFFLEQIQLYHRNFSKSGRREPKASGIKLQLDMIINTCRRDIFADLKSLYTAGTAFLFSLLECSVARVCGLLPPEFYFLSLPSVCSSRQRTSSLLQMFLTMPLAMKSTRGSTRKLRTYLALSQCCRSPVTYPSSGVCRENPLVRSCSVRVLGWAAAWSPKEREMRGSEIASQ